MLREVKVGLLVIAALGVLAGGIFLLGERQNLFRRTNDYYVHFDTVSGLSVGSPVQLNGVNVGSVHRVILPQDPEEELLTVWVEIDRRFADRVRGDSQARIKTFGLLGDKYVEVTSGSPEAPPIPADGEIPAAPATDVDKLIASGENVVDNVVAISHSLRNILARMERGEGLLGELTVDTEAGREVKESLVASLKSLENIAAKIEAGEGSVGRLITDDGLAERLTAAVGRLEGVLGSMEEGEGALPALLNDPATRESTVATLENLKSATGDLSELAGELRSGGGLLPRLLSDEAYGQELSEDLKRLIKNLSLVSDKLEGGEGTLGKLIEDPQVYQAINDIIVGIDESWMLRWLIRNRQKAGIEKRYDETRESGREP